MATTTPANVWTYLGYTCRGGYSYECRALKLYGYRGPSELEAAIRRELRKRAKRATAVPR